MVSPELPSCHCCLGPEQDPVPGPSHGRCKVYQGVLAFPRFEVIEDLLGIGLANVDDCQSEEVPFIEPSWPQAEAGRHPGGDRAFARSSDRDGFGCVSCVHWSPPGWLEALRAAGPRRD